MRVAMLASARPRCGIAAYSRSLAGALARQVDLDFVPVDPQPPDAPALQRLDAADLIHIQHEYSFWGSALPGRSRFPELVRRLRGPWVTTAHTVAPAVEVLGIPAAGGGGCAAAKRLIARLPPVRRFVEVEPFQRAAVVIVHSEAARAMLLARGLDPGRVRTLPMPCPTPAEPQDPEAARRALGLLGRPYFVGFGFITPAKGYEALIEAFAGLDYPGRLVIAGAPRDAGGETYLQSLRARGAELGLGERVLFPGYVEDGVLTELLRGADLAALPYRSGTGSYALSLALACGAPAIASTLPCFDGLPVVRTEPAAGPLRDAIASLLAAPSRREQLAEEAGAWAAEHSWASVAAAHVRIYEEALATTG